MKLPPSERKKRRKTLVKPLVDTFFEWCRNSIDRVPPSSETADGIKYCINQEKYLRVFLDDPQIPLDNNLAEQSIRPFCVGKKNWKLIDTVHGAKASAILYSIVETAKANDRISTITSNTCLQRFQSTWMIQISISSTHYCRGQSSCLQNAEKRRKLNPSNINAAKS